MSSCWRRWSSVLLSVGFLLVVSSPAPSSAALNETVDLEPGAYKVYRLVPENAAHLKLLINLLNNATKYQLDFWKGPKGAGDNVDVMVPPSYQGKFRNLLRKARVRYSLMISDVEKKTIESEKKSRSDEFGAKVLRDSILGGSGRSYFNFREYQSYETMRRYLRSVEFAHPQIARVYTIGTSHEGRPIEVIKIGNPVENDNKRIIWLDGGMHAREWAAPHVATYFIHELTSKFGRDNLITTLLNNFNFFVAPNVNPDGYEYSRSATHPVVRLWRKNRSPSRCPKAGLCCSGVDLNRNFDVAFGTVASSPHPCAGTYHGGQAFSEPESRAVRDVIWGRKHLVDAFVTLHTYSQMWTHPYGFVRGKYPKNIGDLQKIGRKSITALKNVHGTRYLLGSSADLIYASSGGSDDWASVKAHVPYVYLIELRPDQRSQDGFILPENQLLPASQETAVAFITMAQEIMKKNILKSPSGPVAPSPVSSVPVGSVDKSCTDIPNPFARQWTCRQQKGWGWCGTAFMRGYCNKSCGECEGGPPEPCDDRPPLGKHSCEDYKQWGMCGQNFMYGFCEITCGTCEAKRFFGSSAKTPPSNNFVKRG